MRMSEEEIRRDHRLARDPDEQVHILAELNCTTRGVIRRILGGETWTGALRDVAERAKYTQSERRKCRPWTDADYAKIRKMVLRGCRYSRIAAVLGRDEKAVMNAVSRYNKQARERGGEPLPSRRRGKRKAAYDDGAS